MQTYYILYAKLVHGATVFAMYVVEKCAASAAVYEG